MTSAPVQASFTSSVHFTVQPFSAAMASQVFTSSASGMFSFGPQATKFMPSLEHTTISERATLLAASPMNTRVLPLMS